MNGLLGAVLTAALAAAVASDGAGVALRPAILPSLLLALTGLAAAGAGRRMIASLSEDFDEAERTVAGATLGLGVLALGEFALGAVGLFRPWTASALLGALWLYGWPQAAATARCARESISRAALRPWLFAAIAAPLALALWACLVPPHQYDSLVYHLALPQEYLRAGRLYAPPGMVYAHFPQNGEMFFTLALSLGSDLLAQMYVWLAAALSVAWLLTFGRRVTAAAPWAALLVATHTAVLLMASTTYVEPLVMLWVTAALLMFEASGEGRDRGLLILSGVFAGLALGTKYYAGLLAVALVIRLALRGRWNSIFVFSAAALALFAPWCVKNFICVGNPVFPFLYKVFPATSLGWTSDLASGYFAVLTEYGHGGGFWHDLMRLPVLLLRNPLRFGGGMDVLGDLGWDLTLWLFPYGLWVSYRDSSAKGLALACVVYAAGWFSTGVVLRFLTALAPAMALIGVVGVAAWRQTAGPAARRLAAFSAGTLVAAHLFLFFFVHGVFGSAAVLLTLDDRETFLTRRLDYYPCAAFARDSLSATEKILVVGEQRGYYLNRPHLSSTVHAPNLYVRLADGSGSPEGLARALRADGFTQLLFVPREASRLGAGLGEMSEAGVANWKGLERYLRPTFQGPACVLVALGGA
jgi:hypothetical protein